MKAALAKPTAITKPAGVLKTAASTAIIPIPAAAVAYICIVFILFY